MQVLGDTTDLGGSVSRTQCNGNFQVSMRVPLAKTPSPGLKVDGSDTKQDKSSYMDSYS